MFFRARKVRQLDLSSFDTSNVTTMYQMFGETFLDVYDLSSFDMSNVTRRGFMFYESSYNPRVNDTIGYARTEADAAILNSGTGAGPGRKLVFVTK